jgi:hypothetical protein
MGGPFHSLLVLTMVIMIGFGRHLGSSSMVIMVYGRHLWPSWSMVVIFGRRGLGPCIASSSAFLASSQRNTQDQIIQYHISLLNHTPELIRQRLKIRCSEDDVAFRQHGCSEKRLPASLARMAWNAVAWLGA